jgi:hypothetical protein
MNLKEIGFPNPMAKNRKNGGGRDIEKERAVIEMCQSRNSDSGEKDSHSHLSRHLPDTWSHGITTP